MTGVIVFLLPSLDRLDYLLLMGDKFRLDVYLQFNISIWQSRFSISTSRDEFL